MKNLLTSLALLFFFLLMTSSCNKEKENEVFNGKLEFNISSLTALKSLPTKSIKSAIVSIQDSRGNMTFDKKEIVLLNMNGNYISNRVSLTTGNYNLTLFMLIDSSNNVIYASPIKGSSKASLVSNPLPINFLISKDQVTELVPEVISSENSTPQDFGYTTFSFIIVNPDSGLVAYYPLNGNMKDASGNGKDGTNYGATDYLSGIKSLAKHFNNSFNPDTFKYLEIPNVINSSKFSINFWVKVDQLGQAQNLFYLSMENNWVTAKFGLYVGLEGKFEIFVDGLDLRTIDYSHQALVDKQYNTSYLNSTALSPNIFYNITLIYQNNTVSLYLNGVEDAVFPNVTKQVGTVTSNIKMGVSPTDASPYFSYPLVGVMDEIRFYNRALALNEIQLLSK